MQPGCYQLEKFMLENPMFGSQTEQNAWRAMFQPSYKAMYTNLSVPLQFALTGPLYACFGADQQKKTSCQRISAHLLAESQAARWCLRCSRQILF